MFSIHFLHFHKSDRSFQIKKVFFINSKNRRFSLHIPPEMYFSKYRRCLESHSATFPSPKSW